MNKIGINNVEVFGFKSALRGMRNPMNSWDKGDSTENHIGENDLKLAQMLLKSGTEHCKFMRQIHVWMDINMPRYIWSELDTYHFNTKNSCSTMHRLLHKTIEITKDLFIYDEKDEDVVEVVVKRLNEIREEYLKETNGRKKNKLIRRAKQLLPEGFLQLRTMDTNYSEIRNIVLQRRNHRLKEEWQDCFCKEMTKLPYAKELVFYGIEKEYERFVNS